MEGRTLIPANWKAEELVSDGSHDTRGSKLTENEWRVASVATGSLGKVLVIGWDDKTEDEERDHVEERDTPEDLLGGSWNGLSWVGTFSCG